MSEHAGIIDDRRLYTKQHCKCRWQRILVGICDVSATAANVEELSAGTVSVTSSVTVLVSSPSTGASLTGAMDRVSVEVSVPPLPSETV